MRVCSLSLSLSLSSHLSLPISMAARVRVGAWSSFQPIRIHLSAWIRSVHDSCWPITPRLPLRTLLADPKALQENLRHRNVRMSVKRLVSLYEEYVSLQHRIRTTRTARNRHAESGCFVTGDKGDQVQIGRVLKATLAEQEEELERQEMQLRRLAMRLPNTTHPSTPVGRKEAALLVDTRGTKPIFSFPPRDHVHLAGALDMVDFESASLSSGSKFVYLRNDGALLQFALVNWALKKAVDAGFTPVVTPELVRPQIVDACGFHPRGRSTEVYTIRNRPLCLIGTSEHALAGMFSGKILSAHELPIRLVGVSSCFRTEAGSHGKYSKGLYRVHQFYKVELFSVTSDAPGVSDGALQEIVNFQKLLCDELGLHARVLNMPTRELGSSAFCKYDIEAWMPGRDDYGEITSASNCTDYQSRRLNIRFHDTPKNRFVHTVNGTAVAVPRTMIAILESFQQEDGSVVIPAPLRSFMGARELFGPHKR